MITELEGSSRILFCATIQAFLSRNWEKSHKPKPEEQISGLIPQTGTYLIRSKVLHMTFDREGCWLRNSKVSAKHSHSLHLRLSLPAVTSLTQFLNSQTSPVLTHHSSHTVNCINLLLQTLLSLNREYWHSRSFICIYFYCTNIYSMQNLQNMLKNCQSVFSHVRQQIFPCKFINIS